MAKIDPLPPAYVLYACENVDNYGRPLRFRYSFKRYAKTVDFQSFLFLTYCTSAGASISVLDHIFKCYVIIFIFILVICWSVSLGLIRRSYNTGLIIPSKCYSYGMCSPSYTFVFYQQSSVCL